MKSQKCFTQNNFPKSLTLHIDNTFLKYCEFFITVGLIQVIGYISIWISIRFTLASLFEALLKKCKFIDFYNTFFLY